MRALYLTAMVSVVGACATADIASDSGPAIDANPGIDAPGADADPGAPDAEIPDAMLNDATLGSRNFTDDSTSDFTNGAGTFTETTVESWGAVAPVAYYTGGLVQRASDAQFFTDGTTATWAQVQGFTPTGKTSIAWNTYVDWTTETPPSVGLTDGENWTQWYEGEIYLEAGTWTFSMLVDDHGFVEIAQPATTTFARLVSANWATESSGPFTAGAAGWYPFRFAIVDQTVGALVQLRFAGPGVGQQPIPRHRFRARTDQLTGLVQAGFDDSHGVGDVETTIDTVGPGYTNWDVGNPGDLGMTASDTFSVRWTGQFRVDVGGTYTFRYATDDGQRLWIDGVKLLDVWGDTTANNLTGPISLAPGWHELVVEQSEHVGGGAAFLTIETGPELAGQPLPAARLRPVEGRTDRIAGGGVNHADITIPDLTTVSSAVTVTAPPSSAVTSIDVNYEFTHTFWGDLVITLQAPNGAQTILRNRVGGATSGALVERFTTTALNSAPAGGTWTLIVQDAAGTDSGTLLDFAVTPHFNGGEAPIPMTATYESTVRDLLTGGGTDVTSIDTLTWTERVPAGTDVSVSVRTCASIPACATASWSPALSSSGGTPSVAADRYLQYKVDFTGSGDRAAALESLRVDYRVAL